MNRSRLLLLSTCVVAVIGGAIVACGDDDALVRPRDDGGTTDGTVTGDANGDANTDGQSACGLQALPTDYVSAAYGTNAKLELDLRTAFGAFNKPMADNESAVGSGDAGAQLTKAQLDALWNSGSPSLKSITTPYYQGRIDAWLRAYETAAAAGSMDTQMALVGTAPDAGPPASGGFYGKYVFDDDLVDLRQAIEKGSFTAAFFNHAVGVVTAGGLTEASIDRLVAAWGAHASFQNNHEATMGATTDTRDVNSAGYAARRTPKDGKPGPYTRAKAALIKAKAAIAAGATCNAERDAAIKEFFLEWEKGTYATVVFYFNSIVTKLSPAPGATDAAAWSGILHSHGECIGFIAGFKTTPQAYRKISDAQIDAMLAKALFPEGGPSKIGELKSAPTTSVIALNGAIQDIKTIYGFSDEEITSFKQVFSK